jgi:hypothetical protein
MSDQYTSVPRDLYEGIGAIGEIDSPVTPEIPTDRQHSAFYRK